MALGLNGAGSAHGSPQGLYQYKYEKGRADASGTSWLPLWDFLIEVSLSKFISPNTFQSEFPAHHWSRHCYSTILISIPNSFLAYLLLQSLKNVSYATFQHPWQPGWPCDAIPSSETEDAVSVGALGKDFSPLMQGADIAATTSPFSLPWTRMWGLKNRSYLDTTGKTVDENKYVRNGRKKTKRAWIPESVLEPVSGHLAMREAGKTTLLRQKAYLKCLCIPSILSSQKSVCATLESISQMTYNG